MRLSIRSKFGAVFPALLLLTAAVLRNDTNTIPPGRWRYDRFITADQLPAEIDCRFRVERGPGVRVELVTEENLAALLHHSSHEAIASSTNGWLHYEIGVPGTFAIVVFNDDQTASSDVALLISLNATPGQLGFPKSVPPNRKLTVFALSFIGFFGIVTVSGHKLLSAIRRERASPPEPGTPS